MSAAPCPECARIAGQHQYFCSAVARYSRARIAGELRTLDRRWRRLLALAAELRALECIDGADAAERAARQDRFRFWKWAERLGVSVASTREDIRRLVLEIERADDADHATAR